MIKVKRSLLAASALGIALFSTGAQAAFSSFWFDPDGAGSASAFLVGEYMGLGGDIRVNNTYNQTGFNFTQYGNVKFTGVDGGGLADLTAAQSTAMNSVGIRFSGAGTGALSGALSFTSGVVEFFSPLWTSSIGKFSITEGSGGVDGKALPNGQISLTAKASGLSAGYFFKDNSGVQGVDLSTDLAGMPVWAFSTTNLSILTGSTTAANNRINAAFAGESGYVNGVAGNTTLGGGLPSATNPYTQFFASVGGQYRSEVPEPESLALVGLGLVALVASRRRKAAK